MPRLTKTVAMSLAFAAVCFFTSLTARADIVIVQGNIPQTDENVLLNTGITGNPIFGTTNMTNLSVRFSSTENITAPANGQARIEAADGTLTQLTIDIPGATFTSLIFNVDAATDGSITILVTENNGQQTSATFALSGSGENFFTVTAVNGQLISSVSFTTNVAMTLTSVDDVAQVRIGGAQLTQTAVPEPATMFLLGTALAGLGSVLRKNRRKT